MSAPRVWPLPAQGPKNINMFERSRRTAGGSARSYSENVRTPDSVRADRQRTIAILLLCVFVPPLGCVCLWRGGFFSIVARVAATLVATACLTLFLYIILPEDALTSYSPAVSFPSAVTEYSPSSITPGEDAQAADEQ